MSQTNLGTTFLLTSMMTLSSYATEDFNHTKLASACYDNSYYSSQKSFHEVQVSSPYNMTVNGINSHIDGKQNRTSIATSEIQPEQIEEKRLVRKIEEIFGEEISEFWTPALEPIDKNCLLVAFKNQEKMEKQYEDLEFELYKQLEDFLKESKFFNMVALL